MPIDSLEGTLSACMAAREGRRFEFDTESLADLMSRFHAMCECQMRQSD